MLVLLLFHFLLTSSFAAPSLSTALLFLTRYPLIYLFTRPPPGPEGGGEGGAAESGAGEARRAAADGSGCPSANGRRAMARGRAAYEYTEAEDKSMRLGFLLIAAGLLSLLGLGCCWLRPALQERGGGGAANCTVLAVRQLGERFACTFSCGAACRGTARYPCLQVLVRTSRSSAPALLHEDERQLRTNPKVSAGRAPLGAALGGWDGEAAGAEVEVSSVPLNFCTSPGGKVAASGQPGQRCSFFRGGRSFCLLMPGEEEMRLNGFQKTPRFPLRVPDELAIGSAEPRRAGLSAGSRRASRGCRSGAAPSVGLRGRAPGVAFWPSVALRARSRRG